MLLSAKVWSDFGSHIALIRSFSLGDNAARMLRGKAPEYPLFPGEPIRYHFLFYLFVGLLEKIGLRIDWAINIPSALGFFLLLSTIYILAMRLFKDHRIAILGIIFFLFNGSLSFIRFFQTHPISFRTPMEILRTTEFTSFAPWGKGDITAFWNLNIYTNQRHLALAFGIGLLFLMAIHELHHKSWKQQRLWAIGFGLLFGIFPFFHQPTLVIIAVCMAVYFFLFPKLRIFLLVSGAITFTLAMPQLLFLTHSGADKSIAWYPGYLIHDSLTLGHFVSFWWQNLGLHLLLIPLGFILAPRKIRQLFFPIFFIFIMGNTVKFSVEAAANHKFFNFALIIGNLLSAYALVRIWSSLSSSIIFIKFISLIIVILLVFFSIFSGVIDFMVVVNDVKGPLADIPANKTAAWIAKNTPKDAVILNSSFLYHPASIAGRKIFLGWPYFAWSAGYNTYKRLSDMQKMYESTDRVALCAQLKANHISYITFQTRNASQEVFFREAIFNNNFIQVFSDAGEGFTIYQPKPDCVRE